MKNVYISGPMSGIANDNCEEFEKAEQWLVSNWCKPINPIKLALDQDRGRAFSHLPAANYAQRVAFDIKAMAEYATAVCVLPGWEDSTGASIEVAFAVNVMGIPVYEAYTNKPVSLNVVVTNEEAEAIQTMEQLLERCSLINTMLHNDKDEKDPSIVYSSSRQLLTMLNEFESLLTKQIEELNSLNLHTAAEKINNECIAVKAAKSKLIQDGYLSDKDRFSVRSSLKLANQLYSLAIDPPERHATAPSQAVAN